jgi:hypothetical protein
MSGSGGKKHFETREKLQFHRHRLPVPFFKLKIAKMPFLAFKSL